MFLTFTWDREATFVRSIERQGNETKGKRRKKNKVTTNFHRLQKKKKLPTKTFLPTNTFHYASLELQISITYKNMIKKEEKLSDWKIRKQRRKKTTRKNTNKNKKRINTKTRRRRRRESRGRRMDR